MATVGNEELARASEELSSFQSFMAPAPTTTPTTMASSQSPTEMPVDGSKNKDNCGYPRSNDELKSVVKALGRLVLRQEDSLAVMQLDCQFVIFTKNKSQSAEQMLDWSVTSQLVAVAGTTGRTRKRRSPRVCPSL